MSRPEIVDSCNAAVGSRETLPSASPDNKASGVIGRGTADTPPPLDPWADEDGHQLRTRAVRCRRCVRRETWNYDAVCCGCRS